MSFLLIALRKEGYTQSELDYLQNLVIPNLTYGLSVYGAVNPGLTTVWCFLDQCRKRRYISKAVNIYDLLKKTRSIKRKHPLRNFIMPKSKVT